MSDSYRKTIRFNPEYDQEVIDKMKQYNDRNLSQLLRKFIREGFKLIESAPLSDNMSDNSKLETKNDKTNKSQVQTIKWKFPK